MGRYYYLPLILFILSFPGYCQQLSLDDLEKKLSSAPQDTQRVNILNKLASDYYIAQPEKTESFGKQALSLAQSLHYKKGIADAFYSQSLIAKLKADYPNELDLHFKSLSIYQELNDTILIARTFNAMGAVYSYQKDFESARDVHLKALDLFRAKNNVPGIALTIKRLGNIELDIRNYEHALTAYRLSLKTEKSIQNTEGIANVMNNIGVVFYEQNKLDSALYYYSQSLKLIEEINNQTRLPAALHNIARVYLKQGKTDDALALARRGLNLAEKIKSRGAVMEGTRLLSDIFKAKGNYPEALKYLMRYTEVKDSIINQENTVRYSRLQSIYRSEQQEKEIEILKKDQELARLTQQITITGFAIAVIAAGLIIFYLRSSVKRKQEVIKKNEEIHNSQQALIKAELANKHLTENQLRQDLEFRHKELVTYTLNMAQKNTLMENLREGIQEMLVTSDQDSKMKLSKLIRVIDTTLETEKDWDEFKMYFEKVHSSFFENLKTYFPDLSQSDIKLCALVSLNLNIKDMSELMGISPESVKMARHRLRKKLNIPPQENLADFIASFKKS